MSGGTAFTKNLEICTSYRTAHCPSPQREFWPPGGPGNVRPEGWPGLLKGSPDGGFAAVVLSYSRARAAMVVVSHHINRRRSAQMRTSGALLRWSLLRVPLDSKRGPSLFFSQ
jgi:hypothetical protein